MKQFVEQQDDGTQPIINTSTIVEAGLGLFAEKDYPANAFVCYYESKIYPSIVADLIDPTYQIEFIKRLTLDAKKVKTPGKYVNGVPKGKQKNCEFYRVNKLPEHGFDGFIKAWYVKTVRSV